jgi:putative membrane protein
MAVTMCINIYLQRDFSEEWNESLRIKHNTLLGEDEIKRMINSSYKP